jgi:hypothetical protein
MNFEGILVEPVFKWIWRSACTLKFKVFGWLLLMDRLNTRDMMQRRHWHVEDDTCILCSLLVHEERVHLLFTCNFSQRIWNYLGISWFMQPNGTWSQMAVKAKEEFGQPFFSEVVFTAAWNIWTLRNAKKFRNERPTFAAWRRNFLHDITLLSNRIKCKYRAKLLAWISFLP